MAIIRGVVVGEASGSGGMPLRTSAVSVTHPHASSSNHWYLVDPVAAILREIDNG